MNIIILGPQGSGKGTQADLIAKEYRIPHISTGDIFRENIRKVTPLGIEAKVYIDAGNLVPDEVTNNMVKQRLRQPDCKNGYILDGFPRTLNQLSSLFSYAKIDIALNVDLSDEEAIERISGRRVCESCGKGYHINYLRPKKKGFCDADGGKLVLRTDDEPEAVLKRLEIYHTQTQPILDELDKRDILRTVNGSQTIENVFTDVRLVLRENL